MSGKTISAVFALILSLFGCLRLISSPVFAAEATGPLQVSTSNSRYFTDGLGNTILLTGSHHWTNLQDGGLTDPPGSFDYPGYLNFLESRGHNFIRLWTWEQAKWEVGRTEDIWYNPMPYARPGPGTALDDKPKFDLTQFNQAYFDRMRQRIIEAGQRGIYVSIMLFDGWSIETKDMSGDNPWQGHPYNSSNNINGINGDTSGDGQGKEVHTLDISAVTSLQEAYVRKVVDTVNDLDNVLYEISNESHGNSESWQYHMINYIKSYEAGVAKQHPVGMTVEYPNGSNTELYNSPADWVSPNGDINSPPVATGNKVVLAATIVAVTLFFTYLNFERQEKRLKEITMAELDYAVWNMGRGPEYKALRHHYIYTTAY